MTGDPIRDVFRHLAAGVTVVTSTGPTGPVGMTASSVCSLSLDPPLVLVCATNWSRTLAAAVESGRFAVSVLSAGQRAVSDRFASRQEDETAKFAGVAHSVAYGVPVLDEALAWVACDVEATYPGGDHTILVGRAVAYLAEGGEPLVWHGGAYHTVRAADPIAVGA